jgi:hypothetical protein
MRFAQRSGYRRALVSDGSGCNVLRLPADVAQLVEQRFRKPQVTGSNPVVGSSLPFHVALRCTAPSLRLSRHDSMCGFFAINRSRLLDLAPQTSGFKIVFETMVRAGGTLRVREIPIAFRECVRGKSKMSFSVALRFFFRWLRAMFQHLAPGQLSP